MHNAYIYMSTVVMKIYKIPYVYTYPYLKFFSIWFFDFLHICIPENKFIHFFYINMRSPIKIKYCGFIYPKYIQHFYIVYSIFIYIAIKVALNTTSNLWEMLHILIVDIIVLIIA